MDQTMRPLKCSSMPSASQLELCCFTILIFVPGRLPKQQLNHSDSAISARVCCLWCRHRAELFVCIPAVILPLSTGSDQREEVKEKQQKSTQLCNKPASEPDTVRVSV